MAAKKAATKTKARARAANSEKNKNIASTVGGKARWKANKASSSSTKAELILSLLRRKNGASIEELAKAAGWQTHSVRGYLSGTIKKKLGLNIRAEKTDDGVSRYRLDA